MKWFWLLVMAGFMLGFVLTHDPFYRVMTFVGVCWADIKCTLCYMEDKTIDRELRRR